MFLRVRVLLISGVGEVWSDSRVAKVLDTNFATVY
jgi:hypothetical protein